MDLDKKLQEMERKLEQKTHDIEQRTSRKYDEIERRLRADTPEPSSARNPLGPARSAYNEALGMGAHELHIDMTRERSLAGLDQLMQTDFELTSFFDKSMTAYPTTYCETVREYIEPIIADIPMPEERRAQVFEELTAAAEAGENVPLLRSLGVHIPGSGCYINGWLIAKGLKVAPREAFESAAGFAEIVTTASHEKWGHGFITELTALGREKSAVQLGKTRLADQFEIRTVDTPEHARLTEQWRIIFFASNYVEEGYATWVSRHLAERVAALQPDTAERLRHAPEFNAKDVHKRLKSVRQGRAAAKALDRLFNLDSAGLPAIHEAMTGLAVAAEQMGQGFAQTVGIPAPYAVGFCIVNQIANRHGWKVVPCAVATACNIEYGLDSVSNQDLQNYVMHHPNLNVNTRLAAMMYVSQGELNDTRGFLARVKDEAGLSSPW